MAGDGWDSLFFLKEVDEEAKVWKGRGGKGGSYCPILGHSCLFERLGARPLILSHFVWVLLQELGTGLGGCCRAQGEPALDRFDYLEEKEKEAGFFARLETSVLNGGLYEVHCTLAKHSREITHQILSGDMNYGQRLHSVWSLALHLVYTRPFA